MKAQANTIKALIGLSLVCFSGNSWANSPEKKLSLNDLLNIKVVSATKNGVSVSKAPATIYAIPSSIIQSHGYQTVSDILKELPETEIHNYADPEFNQFVTIQGITGQDKFLILLDGVRLNNPSGQAITYNFPVSNAERVEILLGPASALYGADAFSGVINIISKKNNSTEKITGSGYASYGSNNQHLEQGSVYSNTDNFSFGAFASHYASDGVNFPKEYPKEFSWYNNQYKNKGNLILFGDTVPTTNSPRSYDFSNSATFLQSYVRLNQFEVGFVGQSESHSSCIGAPSELCAYSSNEVFKTSQGFLYTHYTNTINEQWSAEANFSMGRYTIAPETKFNNNYTSYNDGYKYARDDQSRLDLQLSYIINDHQQITSGGYFEHLSQIPYTNDLSQPFDESLPAASQNFVWMGTKGKNPNQPNGIPLQIYNSNSENFGGFFQYQIELAEVLSITAGTRWDENTIYGSTFNPRVGIVYYPVERFKMKLLYGSAFLAPAAQRSYATYGSVFYAPDSISDWKSNFMHSSNPNLSAQKLQSGQGSLQFNVTDNFILLADGYYNQMSDLLVSDVKDTILDQNIAVKAYERYINAGKAKSWGGALQANLNYELNDSWSIQTTSSYSYSDGEIDQSHLNYSAKHIYKAGLGLRNDRFNLWLNGQIREHETYTDLSSGQPVDVKIPRQENLDLYSSYVVFNNERIKSSIDLTVNNILNNKRTDSGIQWNAVPQDPILYRIGTKLEF